VHPPRGSFLLVALMVLGLLVVYGREFFLDREGPPAFFEEKRPGVAVSLGKGFPGTGVQQFSDGTTPLDVIKMTGLAVSPDFPVNNHLEQPLFDGETLDIVVTNKQIAEIKRLWMPAAQRIVLGIPLHPDRMCSDDWEALAGIGPRIAQTIEEERQQNGDFGSLAGLQRVKGIGPKRISAWRQFFQEAD